MPKIERSLTASIVELRRKVLPPLPVRNHSTATKIVLCFAQRYACSACFAGTPGNLDTAQGLNNLAAIYKKQQKYAKAEPLAVRALAIREQQLGSAHLDTAASLNNLGLLYYQQER